MKKFTIAHFKKANSNWFANGGRLLVTDDEWIVKYFFREIGRFRRCDAKVEKIPPVSCYQGIRISDDAGALELYFFSKTAERVYSLFGL